jgi:hypothetical protein
VQRKKGQMYLALKFRSLALPAMFIQTLELSFQQTSTNEDRLAHAS